ncbi:DNA replication factor Cdt1 [Halichoeres trimaculatus]|uniref:DNA replication factor Cdt1 n=1 Tax=Halichoeres trimaculatus TaxID=147232 RepID=UPI003D9F8E19
MSQGRVTDFFSQRKKVIAASHKQSRRLHSIDLCKSEISTKLRPPANKDSSVCSSSIHEEFVRVVDEAVAQNGGDPESSDPRKIHLSSPRTPKRSSADGGFDLGAAVFSATATHSTAKKRRQMEVVGEARASTEEKKETARKKLVLPQNTAQDGVLHQSCEMTQEPSAPAAPGSGCPTDNHKTNSSSLQTETLSKKSKGLGLDKEDIATLKTRLQRIKKRDAAVASAASDGPPTPSPSAANSTNSPASQPTRLRPAEAQALKFAVTQASELAAKALRRKTEESKQPETRGYDEQAAYQKYHTLAQAAPPSLSLPYTYRVLEEMFRSMDTVVAMLYNRCETATFAKIKQGVQDMMHKRFEETHVGQIKTIFPEAFTFRQEKNIPTFNSSIKTCSYQLTVEPALPSEKKGAHPVLSASHLLDRRHIFHQNLVSMVKEHHKVFLSSLVLQMSVPDDKLTRWHPRFNVDTVPAVQPSPLPQPPHTDKLSTAQEVLNKARSLITPKMEKALVSLALKDKTEERKDTTSPKSPAATPTQAAPAPQLSTALKGVSQSLLERIRAKEAQKLQAAMTRNSAQEERLLMMSRLPELARILRNVFVSEKKPALIMEVACNRMVASYRSALGAGEMEKHIKLLAEVAADWLAIHPIRKDFYLKLNKTMELNMVLEKLSSRLREEERL